MAQLVKSVNDLAIASVKSKKGLAIASIKSINGLDNTSGGGGTVTLDTSAKTTRTGTGAGAETTCTLSYTCGTLTDGCLIVHVALGGASMTISSVTYNGSGMTQIGTTQAVGGTGNGSTSFWRTLNPASGTHDIVVTVGADLLVDEVIAINASSWSQVNQTTPASGVAQANGNSTSPSVTVNSGTNNRVIAGANTGSTITAWPATDRQHSNVNEGTGGGNSGLSDRAGSASETLTWTAGSDSWAAIGFSLDHN